MDAKRPRRPQPKRTELDLVMIGGSAGSFTLVSRFLAGLPRDFDLPLALCMHRLKDKKEGFQEALQLKSVLPVSEPDDKTLLRSGHVYVAPANYHMLVDPGDVFSLSTAADVQYSRPSIDVLMESAADVYGSRVLGILVSGANKDGATGMRRVQEKGGYTIVQDPEEAAMRTMPEAAMHSAEVDWIAPASDIIHYLQSLGISIAPQASKNS